MCYSIQYRRQGMPDKSRQMLGPALDSRLGGTWRTDTRTLMPFEWKFYLSYRPPRKLKGVSRQGA